MLLYHSSRFINQNESKFCKFCFVLFYHFFSNMKIWDLPSSEEEAVIFFQNKGLLPKNVKCQNNHDMKLSYSDGVRFRCDLKSCRFKKSIRKGTWFENSRLSFLTILRFIYCWSKELTSINFCSEQLNMNHNTVVDWNNYLREVCVERLAAKEQKKIGGPGKVVEINESLYTKRKNNAGRILPQQWIFGGLCRETDECFIVKIPNRSLPVLLEAITAHIEEGTTIYSDSWKGYSTSKLEEAGLNHLKVNHKFNFVDPETKVNTQRIERLWGSAKWRNKKQRGTHRQHLDSYIAEFIWRRKSQDPFDQILNDISVFWENFNGTEN